MDDSSTFRDTPSGITSLRQLNSRLKRLVEEQTRGEVVRVRGMAWHVGDGSTGQLRFLLRHDGYSLPCVVSPDVAKQLPFAVEDRQQLVVEGQVEVYTPWGELQLIVHTVKLDKIVEDQQTLSVLTEHARAEGWLDRARKWPLPNQPKTIGLIAGRGSKAREDVRGSLRDAGVQCSVRELDVNMEGPDTAKEVRAALVAMNERTEVELIVIARGPGDTRSMWAMNNWSLAEAIVHSDVPVMTAIGHREDQTLSDLVADASAPTPSLVGAALARMQTPKTVPALQDVDSRQARDNQADGERAPGFDWRPVVTVVVIIVIMIIVIVLERLIH